MSVGSAAGAVRRLRELGMRPSRELGQNFLVDENVLGLVLGAARLEPADAVLEIGGGLGTLSERLAPHVAHLHVVEIDPRLVPILEQALGAFANATLHLSDVMDLDLAALRPEPSKVVANLPYGVAATSILRSIDQLPAVDLWVVMVQREVAERLAAQPGSKTYGISSVLVQLACDVRVLRRVPPSVFRPAPRVDSALVELRRTGPAPAAALVRLVQGAFAHRRKPLAGSLALAEHAPADMRERAHEALAALGYRADTRAERLTPADFARLAERLEFES